MPMSFALGLEGLFVQDSCRFTYCAPSSSVASSSATLNQTRDAKFVPGLNGPGAMINAFLLCLAN